MKNPEYAIIVAGGKGTRMMTSTPKQFLLLQGKPVLMHTLEAFRTYSEELVLVLVLPADDQERWKELCAEHKFNVPHRIALGGDTRYQSVKSGLAEISGDGLVAIHDGVRPLVSADLIGASFRLAAIHQSAVCAVRLKDSIRITDQDRTRAVDRSQFRLIQTPQTFRVSVVREAYQGKEDPSLTDDASVVERLGHTISLFEGSYENLKITTPEDLVVAEALLRSRG